MHHSNQHVIIFVSFEGRTKIWNRREFKILNGKSHSRYNLCSHIQANQQDLYFYSFNFFTSYLCSEIFRKPRGSMVYCPLKAHISWMSFFLSEGRHWVNSFSCLLRFTWILGVCWNHYPSEKICCSQNHCSELWENRESHSECNHIEIIFT